MSIQILVIGRNEEIVETVARLVNKNDHWMGRGSVDDAEALRLFEEIDFDIVLLSGGIAAKDEYHLCNYFTSKQPGIVIIQHFGGGSGLLYSEIQQAIERSSSLKHKLVSQIAPTVA